MIDWLMYTFLLKCRTNILIYYKIILLKVNFKDKNRTPLYENEVYSS